MAKPRPAEATVNHVLGILRELTDESTKRNDGQGRPVADIVFRSGVRSLEQLVCPKGVSVGTFRSCIRYLLKAALVESAHRGPQSTPRWVVLEGEFLYLAIDE